MGVGAGFLGGAVVGSVVTMGVYHRYHQYRMMSMMAHGGMHDQDYYNNYYSRNRCYGGCPIDAVCEWGLCQCRPGLQKVLGRCVTPGGGQTLSSWHPQDTLCSDSSKCQAIDINMVCGEKGKCECRRDMRWNSEQGSNECQLYIDVDCSKVTYDTKPSPVILEAVNKTLERIEKNGDTAKKYSQPGNTSNATDASPNATIANSLLSSIDPENVTDSELTEAFCRDIDSFSFEFSQDESGDEENYGLFGLVLLVILIFALFTHRTKIKDFFNRKCRSEAPAATATTEAVAFTSIDAANTQPTYNHAGDNQPIPNNTGGWVVPKGPESTLKQALPYPVQPLITGTSPTPQQALPYAVQPDINGTSQPLYPAQPGITGSSYSTQPGINGISYPVQPGNTDTTTSPPPYQPPSTSAPAYQAPYPQPSTAPAFQAPYPQPSTAPYPQESTAPPNQSPYPINPPASAPYPPSDPPPYNPTQPYKP